MPPPSLPRSKVFLGGLPNMVRDLTLLQELDGIKCISPEIEKRGFDKS